MSDSLPSCGRGALYFWTGHPSSARIWNVQSLKRYNILLPRKQRPKKLIRWNDTILQILQDGLENPVSIRQATLSLISRRYFEEVEGIMEQEPRSEIDSKESLKDNDNRRDNVCVVNKTVHLSGSETRLRYVLRWNG